MLPVSTKIFEVPFSEDLSEGPWLQFKEFH